MTPRIRCKAMLLAPILPLAVSIAHAQPAAEAEANGPITEIIVTALKRSERLLDVPASITALGEESLKAGSIDSANDLVRAVPSLTITDQGPGQRRFTLRGVRSAGDAQVGIYYDETPLVGPPGTTSDAGASQSDFRLFDIERVEVLRGPQGTLYGSGSVGGTIRLVTQKPGFEPEAKIDLTGTSTRHGGKGYQINTALNAPLVADKLAARVVYFRQQDDGWVDNPGLGLERINRTFSHGGRLLVRALPVEGLTLDLAAHYLRSSGGASTWSPAAGTYNAVNRSQVPYSDEQRVFSFSGKAELGFADAVFTTSYQDRDSVVTRDPTYLFQSFKNSAANCRTRFATAVCATPAGITAFNAYVDSLTPVIYYQPQSVSNWTNEFRLQSSDGGPLQWTVGLYYEDRDARVLSEARRTSGTNGLPIAAAPLLQRHVVDDLKQKAVFGEVTYEILPDLKLTGGGRYYDYDKTVGGDTTVGLDILRTSVTPFALYKSGDKGGLYKANISWKPDDAVQLYAQAASGYRPGGVNQVLGLAQALGYQPDDLKTYEAGAKASLFDGLLTGALSGYITDWSDMQVSINSGSFVYLGNAGAARIKGLELEAALHPLDGLTLSGYGVLTSAKLTQDQVPDGVTPLATTARKGDRVPFIARKSFSLSATYEAAVSAAWNGFVRGDVNYVGPSRADFRPNAIGYRALGDCYQSNVRLGVDNGTWGLQLYVNNLTDEVGRVAAGNVLGGSIETVTSIAPRTVGVNLNAKF